MALEYASYGYILENGRVVMDGEARALAANEDVKEFYLGVAGEKGKSFRDVKHYKRRKRWLIWAMAPSNRRALSGLAARGAAQDQTVVCLAPATALEDASAVRANGAASARNPRQSH